MDSALLQIEAELENPELEPIGGARVLGTEVQSWKEFLVALEQRVKLVTGKLDALSEEARETFDSRLQRALKAEGLDVVGSSGALFADGIVQVVVDKNRWRITLNGSVADTLAPKAIAALACAEVKELRSKALSPEDFFRSLKNAYEQHAAAADVKSGAQLPLLSLLPQMTLARQSSAFLQDPRATKFKEYPVELFRAELYGMMAASLSELDGWRFHHASGASTKGALFMVVPSLGRPAYVGRIWFEACSE